MLEQSSQVAAMQREARVESRWRRGGDDRSAEDPRLVQLRPYLFLKLAQAIQNKPIRTK